MEDLIKKHWSQIKKQCQYSAFKFFIDKDTLHGEVLERIWTKRDQFSPKKDKDTDFMKWVGFIIKNICIDIYRRENKNVNLVDLELAFNKGTNQPSLENRDLILKAKEYIRKTYNGDSNIFEMRLYGLKYEEIALECDMPLGTVKCKLNRMRENLKEQRERIKRK